MKRRSITLCAYIGLFILLLGNYSPVFTYAKPFLHKETYGKWTKKVSSDGSKEPLYVTFTKEYGSPDVNGIVYDRASIVVMEPPPGHNSYSAFEKFMSPESIPASQGFQITADPVTSSTFLIGAFTAKVLRGSGTLIKLDRQMPDSRLLGKGYYLTLPNGIIEVLVQVQTVIGDIEKIEREIDEFITSFRFGEPEDLLIIRAIKGIPFHTEKPIAPIEPITIQEKPFPWGWFFTILSLFLIILIGFLNGKKHRKSVKLKPKKKGKKQDS